MWEPFRSECRRSLLDMSMGNQFPSAGRQGWLPAPQDPLKNPRLIFKSYLTSKNPRWNINTSDIIWVCPQLQVGHTSSAMVNRQLILQSFAVLFLLPTVSGLPCLAFCRFWTMNIDTFRRRKTSQACKAWVVLGPNWLVYIWYLGTWVMWTILVQRIDIILTVTDIVPWVACKIVHLN